MMGNQNWESESVDPLQHHSCLFLTSFVVSEVSFHHQLSSVHNHLKSTVSNKPREQAKNIVEETSKTISSKAVQGRASMEKSSEVLPVVTEDKPRERRPDLGRKRPRFSINPDSSQPALITEPKLDSKKYKNPDEYFDAYERNKNAKREIQRQMGVFLADSALQNTTVAVRSRRPGLPGHNKRRSINFGNKIWKDDTEANNSVISSQEQVDSRVSGPECLSSQQESACGVTSQGTQPDGSVPDQEDKIDEFLDQLLSCDVEELEGGRAVKLLREHLQIKPIELPKLNIPDFPDLPKIDLSFARGKLRLSSIAHMKQKQGSESSNHDLASPNPPKSPFALLPSLNRRISRSSSLNDPFSAEDVDLEPVANPSRTEQVSYEFSDVGMQFNPESPLLEKDEIVEASENLELSKTRTSKLDGALDVGSSGSHLPEADDMDIIMDNEHGADTITQLDETTVQDEVTDKQDETETSSQPSKTEDLALNSGLETKINQEQSNIPLDKKGKEKSKSRKASKKRDSDRRKSFAGAGTKWEDGVRRSTRFRTRPLEYWNGERLLFGRIHKSLPTLIGIKYASPGKDSKNPTLKVKSFVSDEYSALVKQAALL